MHKRVLMIAFHYPPCAGSSGLQRALKFSRYLPEEGWQPLVLSASPRAYPQTSQEQLAEIPADLVVKRSFCVDAARHLSLAGRYPRRLALPDRWASWRWSGVRAGLRLIEEFRPTMIWSTYPIATAHLIAGRLQRASRLPWIADFRDSMTEPGYPSDPVQRRQYLDIERLACENARAVVFSAPGALRMYAERYPHLAADHWVEIPNGYDDLNFPAGDEAGPGTGKVTLLHSGVIYPSERDPTHFFDALAQMKARAMIRSPEFRVVLRATGHDGILAPMIEARGLGDIVTLAPPIAYTDALREMKAASGLLLFQASNCNHQIPAKLYEYMRAGRPVLGLTDPVGDTAVTMRRTGLTNIVRLDDQADIVTGLGEFLDELRSGRGRYPDAAAVAGYSRRRQTTRLAELFDRLL